MVEEGNFRVEKFNDQNYQLWKMQMEDYLYYKDMYLSLSKKSNQLIAMKDEEWEVLDRKALGTIRLCLDSSVDFNISKEKKSAVMKDEEWEVLDRKELGTIWLCLASSVAFNILKEKTIEGVILGMCYWGMMNHVKNLERLRYGLS